jgi:hypothetical protein
MISGFSHEADENRTLPDYYAANSGNSLPKLWGNLSFPPSRVKNLKKILTLQDGTDRSNRNVGEELPLFAA